MTGCTAPCFPRKATGVVHLLSMSTRVIRPLNALEMVSSECVTAGAVRTGVPTPYNRWLSPRLRLTLHSESTCSLGTRRDTSRRCGRLRYDLKLWITHSPGGATYLPR